MPDYYIKVLQKAEDRRNIYHCGVDFYAIGRAILIYKYKKIYQGASTIEQQFVRTVTAQYQKTLSRKIIEQLLSFSLYGFYSKSNISASYLYIAYFATDATGLVSLAQKLDLDIENNADELALCSVVRLKYPQPINISSSWEFKYRCRYKWLEEHT
ncbi:transglycosylase domain-containing protein [Photobacterium kishitanii]|uniref:transglycosylase domain-containing protein n=1 Tax=Photobacterium kishitanii TaxID=318456 RepID=UPI0007F8D75F|nr:transglycosylase domain-containing protein [Photobacterium kishitanii]OBU28968.1 hypothetical protein AYY23_22505 [Photobacterium kishitanii]